MAFTYSFVDNQVYGTDDINDITKCLTGAGVAPFAAKESYSVSDLNALTAEVVAAGVSLDGCKCTAENPGTMEMTVTVSQGIVFFDSGVRLMVDADGYSLPVTPNTKGFIFVYFSPTLQKADIIFDAELPSVGEYVLLAELAADGNIKDEREFARSKITTMGNNAEHSINESRITVYETYDKAPAYRNTEKIIAEIDLSGIDITKFNYLIYKYDGWDYDGNVTEMYEKIFDFKNNTEGSFYVKGTLYYINSMFDIILEKTKFVIVTNLKDVFDTYKTAFKSAMPYFKLV